MKAGDVMTVNVVTASPDTTVAELVRLMLARGISAVPVVDAAGTLMGLVSESDLMRRAEIGTEKRRGAWQSFFTGTARLARDYVHSHAAKAADVMTRAVVSVGPEAPLGEIADLMDEKRIKRVPVVQGGRLVGLVSRRDLLRAFASQDAGAAPAAGDDAAIRARLLAELGRESWSRRAENSVMVTDGVAHLWGLVTTKEESRALELAAQNVGGVKAVENHTIVLEEEPYPIYPGSFLG